MLRPRAFLQPGKQTADHHGVGAGGHRLGHVARIADSAVGDDRDLALLGGLRGLRESR